MTILSSLVKAYDRLPDAPPFGYSQEKIGFVISLNEDGSVVDIIDLRTEEGKKKQPKMMVVPTSFKRPGTTPRPFFLWDNSNYALGVGSIEDDKDLRFAAFREKHLAFLENERDIGLVAFQRYLLQWSPFLLANYVPLREIADQKVVFALEPERRVKLLHERDRSIELWGDIIERWQAVEGKLSAEAVCLVTGRTAPVARTHPPIRGIPSKGGKDADSIVSFNLDAFTSYGHEQGENAPVSEAAAFAYTATLNRFLERDSGHRVQIGDASCVFWADTSDMKVARDVEAWGAFMLEAPPVNYADDASATREIEIKLKQIVEGAHLEEIEPRLAEGVRFCVLALSPNAARLSVRFYFEDDFGVVTENYASYLRDIAFEPWPEGRPRPTINRCVFRTAPARIDRAGKVTFDREQTSSLLSGELLRSIITGNRFPTALLGLLLMRVRSDHVLDSVRVALIKAIVVRGMRLEKRLPHLTSGEPNKEYLMRTDPNDPNAARRLGRLFAVIERTQLAALGDEVNATVKDKFLSAAATTPRQVFPGILKNSQNHTRRLRNGHSDASWIKDAQQARRVGAALERDIGLLVSTFDDGFPAQHSDEEQGIFLVGYYQERFGGRSDSETDSPDLDSADSQE